MESSGKMSHRRWKPGTCNQIWPISILSSTGHVKPCVKLAGPSAKAKYSWETDSELVPWGKGEKYPEQGSEIAPETVHLQAVGADLIGDGVPFA